MIGKERNKFTVGGNHKSKETDSNNSVQSSLNSHPLWVTLYMEYRETDSNNSVQSSLKSYPLWVTLYLYLILVGERFQILLLTSSIHFYLSISSALSFKANVLLLKYVIYRNCRINVVFVVLYFIP